MHDYLVDIGRAELSYRQAKIRADYSRSNGHTDGRHHLRLRRHWAPKPNHDV